MKHTMKFGEFRSINERMVEPKWGHNYYQLNKDVPVKYIVSQSNPTGATGILFHNKEGYIKGKKGAYIIDYYGGHYYVDMKNKFATYIYKLNDQDRGFRDALTKVESAPAHADWKGFMRDIPFVKESKLEESSNRDYAYTLHRLTNCGVDLAQDFLDDNKVNVEKLIKDIQDGRISKWEAERGIRGIDHPTMMKIFRKKYIKG